MSEHQDNRCKRPDPAIAERALKEAELRRAAQQVSELPPEQGGRNGAEPVRYGDWEKNGLAIDF